MTTIAFDGETLASDTMGSVDGCVTSLNEKKIFADDRWRVNGKKVILAGFAGESGVEDELHNIMLTSGLDFMSDFSHQIEFAAIMVVGEDDCFCVTKKRGEAKATIRRNRGKVAVGSGGMIAITAMHLGKSAGEAVKVAIELDTNTGGSVHQEVI